MSRQILMLAQVDDRSGEELGQALQDLTAMGGRNVQLLSSVTKKGRPGAVMLLDIDGDLESDVAAYLAAELGIWGYHVLESRHQHFDVSLAERQVTVAAGEARQAFSVRCKLFRRGDEILRVKVDHDDAAAMGRFVREAGWPASAATVRARVEQEVWSRPQAVEFVVEL